MSEQALQEAVIQKSLALSKQDARKVLVFMTGLKAGKELQFADEAAKGNDRQQTAQDG